MNELIRRHLEWCRTQREEALKALDLYERGAMRFQINDRDVSEVRRPVFATLSRT